MNLVASFVLCLFCCTTFYGRSFYVDWDNDRFVKDGETFRYVSGSFHYSRVPSSQWENRLRKMKAGGLNAAQIYIFWNYHSDKEGQYDFSGEKDLTKFFELAEKVGLVVIVRGMPYSCAEWEFGGLPWFLKTDPSLILRSSDPKYLKYVDEWLDVVLPMMVPYMYNNGGPIITFQFENEYGSYGLCDREYLYHLVRKFRQHLGPDAVLFSTDGFYMSYLQCGALKSQLVTVDFGITDDPQRNFKDVRSFQPHAPLVNSEFYTGVQLTLFAFFAMKSLR